MEKFPFKQEDFKEGITSQEKFDLACDLYIMADGIQSHDQSIFQLIAAINTIKKVLIDSSLITQEDFQAKINGELETIYKTLQSKMQSKQEEEKAA